MDAPHTTPQERPLDFPVPLYRKGDVVFLASQEIHVEALPCPDCEGTKQWTVTAAQGRTFPVRCMTCDPFKPSRWLPQRRTWKPAVRRLTIGMVRINDCFGGDRHPIAYMAHETGIGSGSIYYEPDLFPSEELAMEAAEAKAAASTAIEDEKPEAKRTLDLFAHHIIDRERDQERGKRYLAEGQLQDFRAAVASAVEAHETDAGCVPLVRELKELLRDGADG